MVSRYLSGLSRGDRPRLPGLCQIDGDTRSQEVGEYLVIASHLMVLKSRQLLPTETVEEEEIEIDEQAIAAQKT